MKHFETHFLAGSFEQHVAFPALKDTPYLLQGGGHIAEHLSVDDGILSEHCHDDYDDYDDYDLGLEFNW